MHLLILRNSRTRRVTVYPAEGFGEIPRGCDAEIIGPEGSYLGLRHHEWYENLGRSLDLESLAELNGVSLQKLYPTRLGAFERIAALVVAAVALAVVASAWYAAPPLSYLLASTAVGLAIYLINQRPHFQGQLLLQIFVWIFGEGIARSQLYPTARGDTFGWGQALGVKILVFAIPLAISTWRRHLSEATAGEPIARADAPRRSA